MTGYNKGVGVLATHSQETQEGKKRIWCRTIISVLYTANLRYLQDIQVEKSNHELDDQVLRTEGRADAIYWVESLYRWTL